MLHVLKKLWSFICILEVSVCYTRVLCAAPLVIVCPHIGTLYTCVLFLPTIQCYYYTRYMRHCQLCLVCDIYDTRFSYILAEVLFSPWMGYFYYFAQPLSLWVFIRRLVLGWVVVVRGTLMGLLFYNKIGGGAAASNDPNPTCHLDV